MDIKILVDFEVIKALDYVIEEIIVLVEQVKELKEKEKDPVYYEGIFETYNETVEIIFSYNLVLEQYEIKVSLL